MAEGPTYLTPISTAQTTHTHRHLKLINIRFWFNRTTSLSRPVPALTQENHWEKLQTSAQNAKQRQYHQQENANKIMSAAPSGESTQHFNAYTARVSHKDQTSTQVLCESMDPYVKKTEDCKFRPGWRFDKGVMGLQPSLLFLPAPLKVGPSKQDCFRHSNSAERGLMAE